MGRTVWSLTTVALVGASVAFVLFALTSQGGKVLVTSTGRACGLGEHYRAEMPGFDPLTGVPHGYSAGCVGPGGAVSYPYDQPLSATEATRRAIPVPVGFLLGATGAGLVLVVDRRRRAPGESCVARP